MHILHVIPITKKNGKDTLSYFTARDVSVGCIVSVPLRKKVVQALVVATEDAQKIKTSLRTSSYIMRKVVGVRSGKLFSPQYISAVKKASEYFACHTGELLNSLVPKAFFESQKKQIKKNGASRSKKIAKKNTKKEYSFVLQADDSERISTYKSIIREEFAKNKSVFICLPEISEIEQITPALARGIEQHTLVFHSGMTKKKINSTREKALEHKHSVLIIATGSFLSLPVDNIGAIIIEREHASSYKMQVRPFADIRIFAKIFAEEIGARYIAGDIFLQLETLHKQNNGLYTELTPLKFRSLTHVKQSLIDLKNKKDAIGTRIFSLLSNEMASLLKRQMKNNERTFLLVGRRGLYPTTVCSDCGRVVTCPTCDTPMIIHGKHAVNKHIRKNHTFVCHKCKLEETARDICGHCGSWRLTTLGIGTQRAEEEIIKLFGDIKVFRLDKDTATTRKRASEIQSAFYKTHGAVMIGTEMAIPYISDTVENVAVLSVDSLFAIPNFKMSERIFTMLIRLRSRASKTFLIQTRNPKYALFEDVLGGNLVNFLRRELDERKKLSYPPFVTLIKISRSGKKPIVQKDMNVLSKIFKEYDIIVYPAFAAYARGFYHMHMLLKLPNGEWPNKELLQKLLALPPQFVIETGPESIL